VNLHRPTWAGGAGECVTEGSIVRRVVLGGVGHDGDLGEALGVVAHVDIEILKATFESGSSHVSFKR
jgi:hypothetical protein